MKFEVGAPVPAEIRRTTSILACFLKGPARMLGDIQNPRLLAAKGALFVVLGGIATAAILLEHPEWRIAILMAISIWAFCRAYYFAFYVIGHYVDPAFRFAGLGSVFHYWWTRRQRPSA